MLYQEFMQAAAKGDLSRMQEMVYFYEGSESFFIQQRDKNGKTALHFAAKAGRTDTILFLLDCGGNPNIECAKGTTPIHDAASHGQLSAIYILIRNGGNLTVKNRKLETALDIARRKKQMSVVTVLSMKGACSLEDSKYCKLSRSIDQDKPQFLTSTSKPAKSLTTIELTTGKSAPKNAELKGSMSLEKIQFSIPFIAHSDVTVNGSNLLSSGTTTYHCSGMFNELPVLVKCYQHSVKKEEKYQIFQNEINIIRSLRHPRILDLLGIIFQPMNSNFKLVFELPTIGLLHKLLFHEKVELDENQVMQIARDIAVAIQFIHESGYVHCSVTTNSVAVDVGYKVKLCNFEYGQLMSDKLPISHLECLYPYMAPEQMVGKPADSTNDIHGLGIIIWECATKKPLISVLKVKDMLSRKTSMNTKLHHLSNRFGQYLKDLITDCAQKPKRRPTATQVYSWLDDVLVGKLVSSGPSTHNSNQVCEGCDIADLLLEYETECDTNT